MDVEFREIEVGSALHASQRRLRDEVLRKPLGQTLSEAELARDSTGRHFAAVRGEEVLACLGLYPQRPAAMRLRQMAVAPALRGQGLGARLLAFAEAWARANQIAEIELHARVDATGFYEAGGYAREGAPFEEVGIPHVLMRKRF